ncbi:SPRY domain-containing protein 3 [Armadillidium vulgare]|nr:SPRY domain-containing protein 3 [Armadillidium vulgare]
MKKVFGVGPKKLGEGVAAATQPEHVLSCVQPNLLVLVRKLFGNLSTGLSEDKEDMYMSLGSEWPRRQRHPAGVNHSQEHLGKVRAERIVIEGDLLCYSEEEEEEKVGVYIGEAPVCRPHNYFEVEILHMGINGAVSVGLCSYKYPLHKLPGWTKDSVGYHADDGRLFKGKATGVIFGPKCGPGDRMGCGVKYDMVSPSTSPDTLPVFFTKNGLEMLLANSEWENPCEWISIRSLNDVSWV